MVPFIFRSRTTILLMLAALFIKLFSLNAAWVERWYSAGIYPPLSRLLRLLFGWLPFSVGDVLYAAAVIYLIIKTIRFIKAWRQKVTRKALLARAVGKTLQLLLAVYVLFQALWGLNYSRQGIAAQMGVDNFLYTSRDLLILAQQLQLRLAQTASKIDTTQRGKWDETTYLKVQGLQAYNSAKARYPFLIYQALSVKPSLFSAVGKFVGFTGYYNPFTGEAQIKTSIPSFLKPFVVNHEMAHQTGYAKESEANFVAFLTGHQSANNDIRYSIYFELFLYTLSDLRRLDSVNAKGFLKAAPPQVHRDIETLRQYTERNRNPIEPYISRVYDAYLRINSQPKGTLSYNEVVGWLVAYGKKFGRAAI